ncbi:hypothetical protein Cgig2_005703 [Carnegiea gigantea]|uniref:Factor of DNA methylation 1-5/IDN2 domain-containing protein n=1 Tax=Carnegiea gigantea TaxID=171969 RepID=A0A9Q1KH55_9CARY|nr:hypothetical protein Cgig2_005703 [Carnegiea gigantea]
MSMKTTAAATTLSYPHRNQAYLLPSHLVSDSNGAETVTYESHLRMASSQDQLVQRLYKEIEIRNSRIQELESMQNQTGPRLSRLLPSLVQEIDCQKKRNVDMEVQCREKVVSLLREADRKNVEIAQLKQTGNEMGMQNRRLLEKRDMFRRLYNQGAFPIAISAQVLYLKARKVQVMAVENKRLKSKVEYVEKEVRQLIEGMESEQGQGSSEEKNEMHRSDAHIILVGQNVVDHIRALKGELEEKKDEVQYLQNLNETLLVKEHMSKSELLDARQVLLNCLQGMLTKRTMLGVRRMGELNSKPFSDACALKFSEEDWEIKSAEICSLWEEYLKDSHWHPFKHSIIDGKQQEVIDESDERLGKLRQEWGEEAYEAVRDALLELNDYNPSGRYPIREFWNFKEERKASFKEVIEYMSQLVKIHKRKR